MGYGMQIYSANGALQINTEDSSHILYQKHSSGTTTAITDVGTGSSGQNSYYYGQKAVTVTNFSRGEDLVFIQPTGSIDNVRAYVITTATGFTIFSSHNISYRWYTFKRSSSLATPTGYGLVVYSDPVSAGNFVIGTKYTIVSGTGFTSIGAANDNAGTVFTATGVGSGSGTANTIQYNSSVLAARIKGRITGSGSVSVSGESLYALGTFKYSLITSALAPRRGKIFAWTHKWNAARDQVTFGSFYVSGQGYQASGEADLDSATYIDNSLISTLILQAPNP